jgi:hypothetical protein
MNEPSDATRVSRKQITPQQWIEPRTSHLAVERRRRYFRIRCCSI